MFLNPTLVVGAVRESPLQAKIFIANQLSFYCKGRKKVLMGRKKKKTRIKEMETLVKDFKATFAQLSQDRSSEQANPETDAKFDVQNKKKRGT
jgi:iron-sulfur cluster repair protein YtfE (RIC family)